MSIRKSDGTTEPFEEEKLVGSLKRVNAPEEAIDEIVDQIEREMRDGMGTDEIYRRAFELLKKHSHRVAVKYSIRRAMLELGPDGFPFEKFVARIFNVWGYEAVTDQTLMGTCVEHEIDVVAWKDDELAMVEAKYHNEFGMKSDLKVALYVKARFDDLAKNDFDYGGKKRKLTGRYLFTNTKFTDKAITYSECNHTKLVGWNYPAKNNLHEIIEQNGLHPITCITLLSHQQKKDLVGRNMLVCTDVIAHESILHDIGVDDELAKRVVQEVQMIVETAK